MVGVPLNIMCSKRCAMPVMPSRSLELPTCATQPPATDGLVVPLHQQQPHAVGQVLLDDRHLLRLQRQQQRSVKSILTANSSLFQCPVCIINRKGFPAFLPCS